MMMEKEMMENFGCNDDNCKKCNKLKIRQCLLCRQFMHKDCINLCPINRNYYKPHFYCDDCLQELPICYECEKINCEECTNMCTCTNCEKFFCSMCIKIEKCKECKQSYCKNCCPSNYGIDEYKCKCKKNSI